MQFENYTKYLKIKHHIPGRIRIKVNPDIIKSGNISCNTNYSIVNNIKISSPIIHSIKFNLLALSCIIEYDKDKLSKSAWQDFLDGIKSKDSEVIASVVNEVIESNYHI